MFNGCSKTRQSPLRWASIAPQNRIILPTLADTVSISDRRYGSIAVSPMTKKKTDSVEKPKLEKVETDPPFHGASGLKVPDGVPVPGDVRIERRSSPSKE